MDIGSPSFSTALNSNFAMSDSKSLDITLMSTGVAVYKTFVGNDFASYQVPTGYKLVIKGIFLRGMYTGNGYAEYSIGYGDTVVSSTSKPTNDVSTEFRGSMSAVGVENYINLDLEVPADKYPYFGLTAASHAFSAHIFGYLEAV